MKQQQHTFGSRRALGILLLAAGTAGAAGALAQSDSQNAEAPLLTQKVRVGLLVPLTGAAAAEGESNLRGATLAVEQINAQGGIYVKDKGGRMLVELVVGDTQTNPEAGAAAAAKLVTENPVDVITGGYSSAVTLAEQPVIAASRTPYLIVGALTYRVTRRTDIDTSWMFHYVEIGPYQGKAMAQFLAEAIRPQVAADRPLRVALLYQDTPFGQDTREGLPGLGLVGWARAQELPLEFVAEEKFPLGATDFRSQLMAIKAAHPDVVVPIAFAEETIAILRQGIQELGIRSVWGPADSGVETPQSIQTLGELNDFLTVVTYFSPYDTPKGGTSARADQFRADFEKRWNEAPSSIAATHYDSLFILKQAIEDAGSLEKLRVCQALAGLDMPALTTPVEGARIRFDKNHEVRFDMFVTQLIRDAVSGETRTKVVWPADRANAEPRLPAH